MSAVDRIRLILDSGLLMPELVFIPATGATDDEIFREQSLVGRSFSPDHVAILREWNGFALDVIRMFGCGDGTGEIGRVANRQLKEGVEDGDAIVIGSDPAGFVYLQRPDRRVFSLDSDGGAIQVVAADLDEFFEDFVFGRNAAQFGGEEWLAELRAAKIVS